MAAKDLIWRALMGSSYLDSQEEAKFKKEEREAKRKFQEYMMQRMGGGQMEPSMQVDPMTGRPSMAINMPQQGQRPSPQEMDATLGGGVPQSAYRVGGSMTSPSMVQTPETEIEQSLYKTKTGEKIKAAAKWDTEAADRNIKFDVLTPKLSNYMEVGARAYQEMKDVAGKQGINLNYEEGGIEAIKANAFKIWGSKTKQLPLMVALERLRPELGTELMRQLGAFRSAEMAQRFANTLAQFSGDIREDIANMSTTLVKNSANTVLLDDNGKRLSPEARDKKMKNFEANLVRKYNFMYRGMGLTTKPYTAKRSFKWLAENSTFSKSEEALIKNAMSDNKGYSRTAIISKLIEKGKL